MNNYIRLASQKDTDEIIKLLNIVTLNLKVKGINQWEYPWKVEKINQDIINENIFVMFSNGLIVGTFSIKMLDEERFKLIKIGEEYIYRIALLPEMQGKNLGKDIINYACKCAEKQSNNLYLDCWNGNNKLREFYREAGLKYIGDYPEEDYYVSVFKYVVNRQTLKKY